MVNIIRVSNYKKTLMLVVMFTILISNIACAIENPDAPDYVDEFKARTKDHEQAVDDPTLTNREVLVAYDDYRIFIDEELNKAYKLLRTKLPKPQQEELIHLRYELPKFDQLLRRAYRARKKTNAAIYTSVYQAIPKSTRSQLKQLLTVDPETNRSLWNQLRQDTGKVTIQEINKAIERLHWIRSLDFPFDPFSSIPYVKFRHFAMEAKNLNANRADEIAQPKKAVLLAAMVKSALARTDRKSVV